MLNPASLQWCYLSRIMKTFNFPFNSVIMGITKYLKQEGYTFTISRNKDGFIEVYKSSEKTTIKKGEPDENPIRTKSKTICG